MTVQGEPRTDRRFAGVGVPTWICLALVALVVAVYAPVRDNGFVDLDDGLYLTRNPHVARGPTWDGVAWAFTTHTAGNWHPLTWLSHMLDVRLFGMDAGAHHVAGLVFHAANTLLLFGFLLRATAALGPAAFVAAMFAVHPTHVESVAWAAERKDVLSTLFLLLTLWAYAAYVRRRGTGRYVLVAACFVAGLLAKPMLVTLPFLLLLLDFWPLRRRPDETWPALVREKLPLFALSAASSVVTFVAQRHGDAVAGLETAPLGARLANALTAYVAYVGKTLWPTDLAVLYPYDASPRLGPALGAALLLVAATALAVRERTRRPWLIVGWLWFLGMLVPVIGLVQVGVQSMADRYVYVAGVGLFVVVAWGAAEAAARLPRARVAVAASAVLAVAACGVVARRQVGFWKDGATLWAHAVRVTDANVMAHVNLGALALEAGRLDEAGAHLEEALRIEPRCAVAQNDLGLVSMRRGDFASAERRFAEAVRLDARYADARVNLGVALQRQSKFPQALDVYDAVLYLDPGHGQARVNRGATLAELGRLDEAIAETARAVAIDPSRASWRSSLGYLWEAKGDLAAARTEFEAALKLDPSDAEARRELAELAGRGAR